MKRKSLLILIMVLMLIMTSIFVMAACEKKEPDSGNIEGTDGHEHVFGEWSLVTLPTETTEGSIKRKCTKEGCTHEETMVLPKIADGNYTATVVTVPTCTTEGKTILTMKNEKVEFSFEITVPKRGHSYGEWEIITMPTRYSKGIIAKECSICNEAKTAIIPMLNDTDYKHTKIDATCTTAGKETYTYTIAGEDVSIVFDHAALGHTPSDISNYCTRCNKMFDDTCFDYVLLDNGTYSIVKFTGEYTYVAIPSEHDGKQVTKMCEGMFAFANKITSVMIPASVNTIETSTFAQCGEINKIVVDKNNAKYTSRDDNGNECNAIIDKATHTLIEGCGTTIIPECVTSIGDNAFSGCTSLNSIVIPNSVTSIGQYAFSGCNGLISLIIPKSVTSIGIGAFSACNALTDIAVDVHNTKYTSRDFAGNECNAIVDKTTNTLIEGFGTTIIPNNATSIGEGAFFNCSNLTNITIPSNVTSIGQGAFSYCTALTSITIPNSVTSIEKGAFVMCSALQSITIPDGVTSIGDYTFVMCSALQSITISEGVTSIGMGAFGYCTALTSITIPSSVTSIGDYTFAMCSALKSITIPESVTSIGEVAFIDCSALTSITMSDGLTSIGEGAFADCTSLAYITIPSSVTSIGNGAFVSCDALKDIYIQDIASWCNITFGEVYANPLSGVGKNLYVNSRKVTNLVIPAGVTSIGDYAFANCMSLTSITISEGVKNIGMGAFMGCQAIKNDSLPSSITNIGARAFASCSNITSTVLPDSLTSIGDGAFALCASLTSVTIPSGVTSIGNAVFVGCTELRNIVVDAMNTKYTSRDINGNEMNVIISNDKHELIACCQGASIPDGVTSICDYAFYADTSLTNVTIPDGVTSIGKNAFGACEALVSVVIPNSVTSIGDEAFASCGKLASIVIPASVTSIGKDVFSLCSSLISIVVDANNTKYTSRNSVGNNCNVIIDKDTNTLIVGCQKSTIPYGVTTICERAFMNCDKLTEITIPSTVTNIGEGAFAYCYSLKIYTEIESKPEGWTYNWNQSGCPVAWGYDGLEHTYTFDTNEGSDIGSIITNSMLNINAISAPTKVGWRFAGWYDNAECTGNPVGEMYYNHNGATLYAKWMTIEEYDAYYNGNSRGQAITIKAGEVKTVNIVSLGQTIYYKFIPRETRYYEFQFSNYDTRKGNIKIAVIDAKRNHTYLSEYGSTSHKLNAFDTYYIEVGWKNPDSIGTFDLTIS